MNELAIETDFQQWLRRLDACPEGRKWAAERTAEQAWDECDRGDWLLWWAARAGAHRKVLVAVCCRIARTALRFVPAGELWRPMGAIETAERWCQGKATIEEVMKASEPAYEYAACSPSCAACGACEAAFYAAFSADTPDPSRPFSSTYFLGTADDGPFGTASMAASAYAYDADTALSPSVWEKNQAWHDARAAKLKEYATIVREFIQFPGAA
jgi:hypothetical protein